MGVGCPPVNVTVQINFLDVWAYIAAYNRPKNTPSTCVYSKRTDALGTACVESFAPSAGIRADILQTDDTLLTFLPKVIVKTAIAETNYTVNYIGCENFPKAFHLCSIHSRGA